MSGHTTPSDSLAQSSIDPGARIGHVHLKVSDLDRALAFLLRSARVSADATL
jgi:hypothetical protein